MQAITDIPMQDLPELLVRMGCKPFAARQLLRWLYFQRATSFSEMTDLSLATREALTQQFEISAVRVCTRIDAEDGTFKLLLQGADGAAFECVLIPAEEGRTTVCLSTQSGCAMGCAFCRTASMGLVRDLTQGEILGQLIAVMQASERDVTNIVFMGMGEPMANIDAVSHAIEILLEREAFNISKRRITLSTSGLLDRLDTFVDRFDIKIAISLNATTDETRDRLMPVNHRYPIAKIMEFCRAYSQRTRHRMTFEYVLIRDVNDTAADVKRLSGGLKGIRAKINLIPFNPFEGTDLRAPLPETIELWSEELYRRGIQANIRISRGQEIMAACGQLAAGDKSA